MRDIIKDIDQYLLKKATVYPQHTNWASSVGHPCERFLTYSRLNWEEKEKPELGSLYIFREGNIHEPAVVKLLGEAGFEVEESQRSFTWREYQITGRIDGKIKIDDKRYPLEIKTMNEHKWEKINSIADIKNDGAHYVRAYYDQMQVYLLMDNSDTGVILIKNKQSGRLKMIEIPLDYTYAEALLKKIERINALVEKLSKIKDAEKRMAGYPDRIPDLDVCQYCAFKSTCLPDQHFDALNLISQDEVLALLEKRELVKGNAKEFEIVNEKLKTYWQGLDKGQYLIGDFTVKISKQKRTKYNIPEEMKEKFAEEYEITMPNIVRLKGGANGA